ncbi:MATE family efflux transporter [Lactococcus fujiensis]|uniref:Probable multidrug resistance protein NorM n=1 Tax=Lactococcus fujiensis JCM 16395 TaxID=1291764 RepID=A0A2A5RNK7_9LACT|nr:MATE family efflux transporter [Lactococcus fujiensis]PCS00924.1 hypothetical protein RT41_GL000714 [Lactococcus fujiensis JCM 16395]
MKLFKEIQKFTLPLIANNLVQILINQLILIFAINQSVENLAGISTIQSLLYSFGGILGVVALAFNIEGGQALGKNLNVKFLKLVKSSFILNGLIGLGFGFGVIGLGEVFLNLVYHFQGSMLLTSTGYLLVQSPYIFLTLMLFLSSNLIKIQNKTKWILWISLFSTGMELLLNIVLVKVLHFGIVGASFSSVFSLFVMVFLQFLVVKNQMISAFRVSASEIKNLIKKSFPLLGQELLEGVIFTIVIEALISRLGVTILAVYAFGIQMLNIAKTPVYMYENAVTVFVSKSYGAKNLSKSRKIIYISLSSSILFYCILSILIFINRVTIANWFSLSKGQDLSGMLLLMLSCSFFFVFYEILKASLQAISQEKFVLKWTFIINLILFLVMILFANMGQYNFEMLYLLYALSMIILTIMMGIKFKSRMVLENK